MTQPNRPRRPRREPPVPVAEVSLDARAEALSALLPDALRGIEAEVGAVVNEVTLSLAPQDVPAACRILRSDPRLALHYLRCLSVVDHQDRLEVNYHLFSRETRHKLVVKTSVPPDNPVVPSVISVWRGADWFEREGHDLFGVVFQGHPNLAPLLLYDGFEGHPGLKSFPFHDYDEW